jgi:hypothetical protein
MDFELKKVQNVAMNKPAIDKISRKAEQGILLSHMNTMNLGRGMKDT